MNPEIETIKNRLNDRLHEVVKMLYPHAKFENNRYRIGNIDGSPGDSMAINAEGPHKGRFVDWASDVDRGDLIDLWIYKKRYPEFKHAINDIKSFLGMSDHYERPTTKPKIDISKKGNLIITPHLSSGRRI